VLQCVAVCYSVLQCVAVCCSVLQCVAVCCSVLHFGCSVLHCVAVRCSGLHCVAMYYIVGAFATSRARLATSLTSFRVLQCVAVRVAVRVAVCCSELQCAVGCYGVLQYRRVSNILGKLGEDGDAGRNIHIHAQLV